MDPRDNTQETDRHESPPIRGPESSQERITDDYPPLITKQNVAERDRLRFAQSILVGVAVAYSAVTVSCLILAPELAKDVWQFTCNATNSIILIVIGYYFGTRGR